MLCRIRVSIVSVLSCALLFAAHAGGLSDQAYEQVRQAAGALVVQHPSLPQEVAVYLQQPTQHNTTIPLQPILRWTWEQAEQCQEAFLLQDAIQRFVVTNFIETLCAGGRWQEEQARSLVLAISELAYHAASESVQQQAVRQALAMVLLEYQELFKHSTQEAYPLLLLVLQNQITWLQQWYQQKNVVMPESVRNAWTTMSVALTQHKVLHCSWWEHEVVKQYAKRAAFFGACGLGAWFAWYLGREYLGKEANMVRETVKEDVKQGVEAFTELYWQPVMQKVDSVLVHVPDILTKVDALQRSLDTVVAQIPTMTAAGTQVRERYDLLMDQKMRLDVQDLVAELKSRLKEVPAMHQDVKTLVEGLRARYDTVVDEPTLAHVQSIVGKIDILLDDVPRVCSELKNFATALRSDVALALATAQEFSPAFNEEKFLKLTKMVLAIEEIFDREINVSDKIHRLNELFEQSRKKNGGLVSFFMGNNNDSSNDKDKK